MTSHRLPQIEDYETLVGAAAVERIGNKAAALKDLRVFERSQRLRLQHRVRL